MTFPVLAQSNYDHDFMYRESMYERNQHYGDYSCRPYYASPMPEQRMRDDFSDTTSEWGLEQPLPLKMNRIPMRRPYNTRREAEASIPKAYPKPGQDLPPGVYSSPTLKPALSPFTKPTTRHTNSKSRSPEHRFFKRASHYNRNFEPSPAAPEHHRPTTRFPYQRRTMKADPAHVMPPHTMRKHTIAAPKLISASSERVGFAQPPQRTKPRKNLGDFDFKYPSYRRGQYALSIANSTPPRSSYSMDKQSQISELRRRETERHLINQAAQYGYDHKKTEKPEMHKKPEMLTRSESPVEEAFKLHRPHTHTSFTTSRDRVDKSASQDTESTRDSSSIERKKVEDEKSELVSASRSISNPPEESITDEGGLKVQVLKGITVESYPGIDISPENYKAGDVETFSGQAEKGALEVEGEWETFELSSYFDMVREVMPRTLFTSEREPNRPSSKWYTYDCRARMYICQQPSQAPIMPQHVAPPPHLTKEEFYEAIGE